MTLSGLTAPLRCLCLIESTTKCSLRSTRSLHGLPMDSEYEIFPTVCLYLDQSFLIHMVETFIVLAILFVGSPLRFCSIIHSTFVKFVHYAYAPSVNCLNRTALHVLILIIIISCRSEDHTHSSTRR